MPNVTALGCPVNQETIIDLIEFAAQFRLNVEDDIDDIEEYYALTGETPFVVMSIADFGHMKNATFTVIGSDDFHAHWEILVAEKHGPFYQIKKI